MKTTVIVGAGGIGGWLVQLLGKMKCSVVLIDGDTVERRNLSRQLFGKDSIGRNKAEAMAATMDPEGEFVKPLATFLGPGFLDDAIPEDAFWFCAADNHPARAAMLDCVDAREAKCCIAANEYRDAEAYYYDARNRGTGLDPRMYYPAILSDHSGDPMMPCTGAEADKKPQLALANAQAAIHAVWLYRFWTEEAHKIPKGMPGRCFPVSVFNTSNGVTIKTKEDYEHRDESAGSGA